MASMLLSLGKEVTLVTDRRALEMYQDIMKEAVRTGGEWSTASDCSGSSLSHSHVSILTVFGASSPAGVLEAAVPLVTFEGSGPDSALRFLCHDGDPSKPRSAGLWWEKSDDPLHHCWAMQSTTHCDLSSQIVY